MSDNVDAKILELELLMSNAIEILEKFNYPQWVAWLEKDRKNIEQRNIDGLIHLKGAFGGMGSINDLYFGDDNSAEDIKKLFDKIMEEIYLIVQQLLSEAS